MKSARIEHTSVFTKTEEEKIKALLFFFLIIRVKQASCKTFS